MASRPALPPSHPADERDLRTREMMARHLGGAAMRAFVDSDVTEIYINPDGRLRFDTRSRGAVVSDDAIEAERVQRGARSCPTVATRRPPILGVRPA